MQLERHDTQQRLKAIEGNSLIKGMDAIELSLIPDVIIPHKFKMLDFVKYKGSTCSRAHMTMFCWKIASHTRKDKLLIHCFKRV